MGSCTYQLQTEEGYASQVAALAEFARYAGVGSKTTSGMGQARWEKEVSGASGRGVNEALPLSHLSS